MPHRRDFLLHAVGAMAVGSVGLGVTRVALTSDASQAAMPKPLRILMIGGTGFAGSHHVHAAIARGHHVTVFSRGNKESTLPAQVEILTGDRYKDLNVIKNRSWDAVIDFAAFAPRGVRMLGQVLQDRVKHYTLISTVMTYARDAGRIDEDSAVWEYKGSQNPYGVQMPSGFAEGVVTGYGTLKVLCEREAEQQFPGKTLVIRPGVISGPEDKSDHIGYWFSRMERGGEILAPGEPVAPIQFIDVRDLASWTVRMVEANERGIYNAVGPAMPMSMSELLGAVRSLSAVPMRLTWVPSSWLSGQGVRAGARTSPFFWVKDPGSTREDEFWISYQVSSDKAHAKGLIYRPLGETLRDNLAWYRTLSPERQADPKSGWKADIEQKLLAAWHARPK